MKTLAFIVCGYGIPKKMEDDLHYQMYLRLAANQIYERLIREPNAKAILIPTGGPTDMHKPYKRTEAGVMAEFLRELFGRPGINQVKSRISIAPETKALSTMENILYSKRILDRKRASEDVSIFCEQTRMKKVGRFAREVFGRKVKVIGIDFDQSQNRYLDPQFIAKKEAVDMRYGLMALRDPKKFKQYRALLEEKFRRLRAAGPKNHAKAVKEYWQEVLKEFDQK